MSIQLRQICLVAEQLAPVIDDLTAILGINSCYVDPGVAKFGLENNLMPVGRNFLEVVAPYPRQHCRWPLLATPWWRRWLYGDHTNRYPE